MRVAGDLNFAAIVPSYWVESVVGARVYVGLENADRLVAIDTLHNKVIAIVPIGQAAQVVVYVPGAVPSGAGTANLQPLMESGDAVHLAMVPPAGKPPENPPTSVSLFDQGLVQLLEAAVTGLTPRQAYVLALASRPDGGGTIEPLARFTTNANGKRGGPVQIQAPALEDAP